MGDADYTRPFRDIRQLRGLMANARGCIEGPYQVGRAGVTRGLKLRNFCTLPPNIWGWGVLSGLTPPGRPKLRPPAPFGPPGRPRKWGRRAGVRKTGVKERGTAWRLRRPRTGAAPDAGASVIPTGFANLGGEKRNAVAFRPP